MRSCGWWGYHPCWMHGRFGSYVNISAKIRPIRRLNIDSIPTTRFDNWYTVYIVSRLGTGELIAGIIEEKLREREVNSEPRTPLSSWLAACVNKGKKNELAPSLQESDTGSMRKPTSREQYGEGTSLASQLPSSTSVWIYMSRITVLLMFPKERRAWVVVLRTLNQENIKFAFNHVWIGARNARGGAFALWVIETSSVRGMGYLEKRDRQNLPPIDTLSKRKIDHLALGKFWLLICI